MILAGISTALGWFFEGISAAPKSNKQKHFICTHYILLAGIGVNFSPIVCHFSAQIAFSGKYNGTIFAITVLYPQQHGYGFTVVPEGNSRQPTKRD